MLFFGPELLLALALELGFARRFLARLSPLFFQLPLVLFFLERFGLFVGAAQVRV